ncbi:maleylpyruvate isomerase family mycothiol-dependent enzyme [Kitasatospora cathayae]|uniref:Maleylpyruvate isomerase family mycothiol-dependent enzyme n=1 Tax=Kitasatospora cathayae TaxID=3004092 RepID=A0ABY7QE90_9ACTN|nr:maleylpyruvate isomerase family mycothiol-dependent enzyme [Kitasatospora sp. HUAS 3-15]WBP91030.1 maleylpyruvate isomerase family mycothiol-dependent enzyme [Kitasatospora sp. HUAS 3-15]
MDGHREPPFDPAAELARIRAATDRLLRTAARLSDADVRAPSLLPGWSRGHVLTHLARNADGGRRLLTWARTGVRTPEYPGPAEREAEIEAGAGRGAAELLADLRASAAAFEAEYRRMPPGAWRHPVRWMRGQERPASQAAHARRCEVLVHHVDLDAGFTPAQWPPDFTRAMLARVAAAFAARPDTPAVRLRATDTGAAHDLGAAGPRAPLARAPQHVLLAWLMGRAPAPGPGLPEPPFLY